MIVGKALFEGTLLKCQFARFFLNAFVNKTNTIDDLKALDADLYNNLMYLKYYDGNAEDLGLTFSISENIFG
jgi:ubiquitin-protein ligase E3 B